MTVDQVLGLAVIAALFTCIGLIARTNAMTRRIEECERLLNNPRKQEQG